MTVEIAIAEAPTDEAALAPLVPPADRIDVHTRLAGPLATSTLIHALDEFREREAAHPSGLRERLDYEFSVLANSGLQAGAAGTRYTRTQSIWEVIRQTIPVRGGHERHGRGIPMRLDDDDAKSKHQKSMLNTAAVLKEVFEFAKEGYEAQVNATFNMALPGYLIAEHELSTSREVVELVKELGPDGISDLLRRHDFIKSLSRLALTANGLLGRASGYYVDIGEELPALKLEKVIKQPLDFLGPFPEPVSVFELYEKRDDGSCRLTKPALENLLYFMRYRNATNPMTLIAQAPGPSRGCPVVQASVRINPADYSAGQWARLTEGENPIAAYNPDSQKLTFLRQAIPETSHFFADIFAGKIS